jgi:Reverse transcriptase (RNA-dependent DNA polymerase)
MGIFNPNRVIQGSTGAAAYCQSSIQRIVGDQPYKELLVWLDDILAYFSSNSFLFQIMKTFFVKCRKFGLKPNAAKCHLFFTQVKWCGQIISSGVIYQDPKRVDGLVSLAPPVTGADLQQFIYALNWMRMSMPDFARVISPLAELLELVCAKASGRKKRMVGKVS